MENNNGNGGSKFANGFLLGAIIGGGLVFLLGSKKGKKILKAITDEGLDNISEFLDQQGQVEEDFDEEVRESNGNEFPPPQPEGKKPLVRRFFRGIRKSVQ